MNQPVPPAEDLSKEFLPGTPTKLEKLKEALKAENAGTMQKTLSELQSYQDKKDSLQVGVIGS